jgi:hypothetical protein
MEALLRYPAATRRDPRIEAWFAALDPHRLTVHGWFERMRGQGDDVREALHDGRPTACIGDAAFAYVDAFTAHAAVGFYFGAMLPDPAGLLEGQGRRMRHVKLKPGKPVDEAALGALIDDACEDIRRRIAAGAP